MHLAEFDAIAADLDLLVGPPQVLQLAIGAPAHQVPGAIHPLSGRAVPAERARHEPRRRQPRPAHIPIRQTPPGHIQLTDHALGHRPQPPIQHEEGQVSQRHTDRAGVAVDIAVDDLPERGMHRGLGDAIHIDQPRQPRVIVQPLAQLVRLERLPTEHHALQLQLLAQLGGERIRGLQRVERRRRLAEHADLFADQHGMQLFGRAHHRVRHDHQPAAVQQRSEDLPHREVERQRVALRPHLPQRQLRVQGLQQLGDVAVRHRHTLGRAGGARRIDDVGDVLRGRGGQSVAGLGRDGGVVEIDDVQVRAVEARPHVRGGDGGDRRGVGEHELHARRRHRGIDRQVGRPGLEHRQDGDDGLGRPGEQHRDALTRPGAPAHQQVRQPVGGLLDLAVRPRTVAVGDGHRLRGAGRLRGEQLRNRRQLGRRLGQHRAVAPLVEPVVLARHRAGRSRTGAGRDRRSWPPAPAATGRSACRWRRRRTPRCRIRREGSVRDPAKPPPTAGSGCTRGC